LSGKSIQAHQEHERHGFRKEAVDCTSTPSELLHKSGMVSERKIRFVCFIIALCKCAVLILEKLTVTEVKNIYHTEEIHKEMVKA
jgi:hypothetical protein